MKPLLLLLAVTVLTSCGDVGLRYNLTSYDNSTICDNRTIVLKMKQTLMVRDDLVYRIEDLQESLQLHFVSNDYSNKEVIEKSQNYMAAEEKFRNYVLSLTECIEEGD